MWNGNESHPRWMARCFGHPLDPFDMLRAGPSAGTGRPEMEDGGAQT